MHETEPISFERDEFVGDLYWKVTLSTGETVYSDDDRPGLKCKSSWMRLKEYLKMANVLHLGLGLPPINIVGLSIHFRSHGIDLTNNYSDGYYLCNGFWASMASEENSRACFVVGHLINGVIRTDWYVKPELEIIYTDIKTEEDFELCLIRNATHQSMLPTPA